MEEHKNLQFAATMRHLRSYYRIYTHMQDHLLKSSYFYIPLCTTMWLFYLLGATFKGSSFLHRSVQFWADSVPVKGIIVAMLVLFLADQCLYFLHSVKINLTYNKSKKPIYKNRFDERVNISITCVESNMEIFVTPECMDTALPTYLRFTYRNISPMDVTLTAETPDGAPSVLEIHGQPEMELQSVVVTDLQQKKKYICKMPVDSKWYNWQLHNVHTLRLKVDPLHLPRVKEAYSKYMEN